MPTKNTTSQRKSIRLGAVLLATLIILVLTLAPPPADTHGAANVQPALLAMAAERPDTAVRVIIQKSAAESDVEGLITRLGGTVIKDLHIINAVVAEMGVETAVNLARDASVSWVSLDAPMTKADAVFQTVRDEFSDVAYNNNDGTAAWTSDWQEIGESDGPASGDLRVYNNQLLIKDDNRGLERTVDLLGAETAVLSFDYRRYSLDSSTDYIALELSNDGGASWTEIGRFAGPASDSDLQPISYDIAPYAAASTGIRFATSSTLSSRDYLYVDNLQIEFTGDIGSPPPVVSPSVTVRDDFNAAAYSGNDGDTNWSDNWQETGETDGPTSGKLKVVSSSHCATGYCLLIWAKDDGYIVTREADLSGATSAILSLNYLRDPEEPQGKKVYLEVSGNGGSSWTLLHTYVLDSNDSGPLAQSFDISAQIAANTQIRFRTGNGEDYDYLYVDNIQIAYSHDSNTSAGNTYLDTLNVQPVWDMGLNGAGIGVAVIDSGIADDQDFTTIQKYISFNPDSINAEDSYGHGTHVAGIVAGNGHDSSGLYQGIAPNVDLISIKISDDTGMAYESDTVDAMQWVLEKKDTYNIRVVNLSFNSTTEQSYHASPMDAAAEILWFNGIVVVASTGNKGPLGGHNTANAAPANDPFIITVGASNEHGTPAIGDDTVSSFSAFGMTMDGFTKPDIIAPGQDIISVLASTSSWDTEYPERVELGAQYFRLSGTSMSAPMVTGAVALLLQDEPNLTPDQVKYRLMHASNGVMGELEDAPYTYPYLDVYALITTPTTESANTGLAASQLLWTGDDPITWGSVSWNSVSWNSVSWNSVSWNSVSWNSVSWNSVSWDD